MSACDYIPDPALLEEVRLMLHHENPSMSDIDAEDFASDAYKTLLEKARAGEELRSPGGMIREIARRDVFDSRRSSRSKVHKATPLAPESREFHELEDNGAGMLAALEEASTEARLGAIVSTLTTRQRLIYKSRLALGMSTAETVKATGLSRSTVKREYETIENAALEAVSGYEGKIFDRAQVAAVTAYVLRFEELAEDDPRRRLVEDDPVTYQLMLEMRASLREQAGEINFRSALAGLGLLSGGLSLAALAAFMRGKLTGAGATQGAGAGTAASAGGGGGGILAAGAGGKVAVGCAVLVCAGGGAAAIKASSEKAKDPAGSDRAAVERAVEGPPAPAPSSLTTPINPDPQPVSVSSSGNGNGDGDGGKPGHPDTGGKPGHPDASSADTGSGTDAAVTGEEFDPLASPSTAPVTPAPSSTDSGSSSSSSSSGGSSAGSNTDASIGGSEFGP